MRLGKRQKQVVEMIGHPHYTVKHIEHVTHPQHVMKNCDHVDYWQIIGFMDAVNALISMADSENKRKKEAEEEG